MIGQRGSHEFLDEEGRFNGDLDALLFWQGRAILRPKSHRVQVWGRRIDLRVGVQYWLNGATDCATAG